jgi:hypothetical protein
MWPREMKFVPVSEEFELRDRSLFIVWGGGGGGGGAEEKLYSYNIFSLPPS